MKSKDIKEKYSIDEKDFAEWIKYSGHPHKLTFTGSVDVDDSTIESVIADYRLHLAELAKVAAEQAEIDAKNAAELDKANQQKQQALANMLVTSGFNFDGYTITKYSGYISGDDAVSMDRPSHGFWGGGLKQTGRGVIRGPLHFKL